MRRDIKVKTGHHLDTSDLTVAAPIRQGLVPSLDAVSYKTRTERVLQLLQLGRQGLHEFELTRVLADAVERVGMIHAVRVAIIEPQNLLMLSVTFDGDWEPYMRSVWQRVSRLLDLIFCNTDDYVYGWESSYEEWMGWLRRQQVNTPFFYSQPGMTAGDGQLLRSQEWLQRQKDGKEFDARLLQVQGADVVEHDLSTGMGDDPRFPGGSGYASPHSGDALLIRQSVRALAALHRLTDVFLPRTHDGWVLHRAAREGLAAFAELNRDDDFGSSSAALEVLDRFRDALNWLKGDEPDSPPVSRKAPAPQDVLEHVLPAAQQSQVQSGILAPVEANHGAVLMLRFADSAELANFLRTLPLTPHGEPFNRDGISVNFALSVEGLRLAGFTDDELRAWPDAFYEGMVRRAGLLGDVRANHPRNWRLPKRLKDGDLSSDEASPCTGQAVELAEMHALLHVRLCRKADETVDEARTKLLTALEAWTQAHQRLALQWLQRQTSNGLTTDHFGWRDAQSGLVFDKAKASDKACDHSHVGEVLCGHANAADHRWPAASQPCAKWLHNGSFLAVRKLRQNVAGLNTAVDGVEPPLDADFVRAKLMGRWHDKATQGTPGEPLVPEPPASADTNDFSFAGDERGALCPFHAHIRRSNPRQPAGSLATPPQNELARPPKLVRRGMSYGPAWAEEPDAERGLFFMAYNASLAEQFEVVQRWLAGGNSGGGDSAQADPLLGVATPGQDRTCLIHHNNQMHRVVLEPASPLNEEPEALVQLEWGAYWFAPSLPIVAEIAKRAANSKESPLWNAHRGEAELKRLLELEQRVDPATALRAWKEALEDPESLLDHRASSIWAAIREFHGGYLKCAYGVLVGDPAGVENVVGDEQRYTATGYQARMRYSFGPIFLGCDARAADGRYERESADIVDAIRRLPVEATYQRAKQLTDRRLRYLRRISKRAAKQTGDTEWRLVFEVRELLDHLLGHFCGDWFGIPTSTGEHFDWGGLDQSLGANDKPRNPGHFASPSRYFFQPHPNAEVARIGEAHGQALRRAMQALLDEKGPQTLAAPLVSAVLTNPLSATDPTYAARTLVGVVMGFVPTVEGTLRRILAEWLREGSFWRLRGACPKLDAYADALKFMQADFIRGIQMRAAPELLWRTARTDHPLGEGPNAVAVKAGDRVVAGLMSATQCHWQHGSPDYFPVFGGNRKAHNPPTHACPGTDAAMALMVGFFAAMLESDLPLRPGPAGLSFEARGLTGFVRPITPLLQVPGQGDEGATMAEPAETETVSAVSLRVADLSVPASLPTALNFTGMGIETINTTAAERIEAFSSLETKDMPSLFTRTPTFAQEVRMLALGDSWLENGAPLVNPTLVRSLRAHGYVCSDNQSKASLKLGGIAERAKKVTANQLANVHWVLLDGGGNDVHQVPSFFRPPTSKLSTLDDLLTKGEDGKVVLNEANVGKFIDDNLADKLRGALTALTAEGLPKRPIVVVAYDHPIPDGRGATVFPGVRAKPWLEPAFTRIGLDKVTDLLQSAALMAKLIDRLNDMVKSVCKEFHPAQVHGIKLTGTLPEGGDHTTLWRDELHPTDAGFDMLAAKLVALLPAGLPRPIP